MTAFVQTDVAFMHTESGEVARLGRGDVAPDLPDAELERLTAAGVLADRAPDPVEAHPVEQPEGEQVETSTVSAKTKPGRSS